MSSTDRATLSVDKVVRSGLCIGCGACTAVTGLQMTMDGYGQLKPSGPADRRRHESQAVAAICPFSPTARNEDQLSAARYPDASHRDERLGRFEVAYVGAVVEGSYRRLGSSGGMVSWVAAELLRRGLVDGVAHVRPAVGGRYFAYTISRSVAEVQAGAKSRYYPVELSAVIDEIRRVPGRYAVVGIPCFVKAVQLLREQDTILAERIVHTLGLFCGHMKSARLVESFAWQMGVQAEAVAQPEFRLKGPERPANWYTAHLALKDGSVRQKDWWHLADGDWGAGFFMNSACNFCDDVLAETADIAFGDAWVEPHSSDWRGTNVVVIRSAQLTRIIDEAVAQGRLDLRPVDADYVAGTQAAGLRQRREGLGYRLSWWRRGVIPRKRYGPRADISLQRKLVYRLRYAISTWSHRVFWLARRQGAPWLYVGWAHGAKRIYHGLAYGRGRIGAVARVLRLTGHND